MAQVDSNSGGRRKTLDDDANLNIVSIIDCLTVLIMYLLAAASLEILGQLEATIQRTVSSPPSVAFNAGAPTFFLTLDMKNNGQLEVKWGKSDSTTPFTKQIPPASDKKWDFATAEKSIATIQRESPDIKNVILLADGSVPYESVVDALKNLQATLPVTLGTGEYE